MRFFANKGAAQVSLVVGSFLTGASSMYHTQQEIREKLRQMHQQSHAEVSEAIIETHQTLEAQERSHAQTLAEKEAVIADLKSELSGLLGLKPR